MVVASIFILTAFGCVWWIIKCYLGNVLASLIVGLLIITTLTVLTAKTLRPTQEQLETDRRNRKAVGY